MSAADAVARRVARIDPAALARDLAVQGWALTPPLLAAAECDALVRTWNDDARFRRTVDMARFRFGEGTYRYFAAPLPPLVAALRAGLYPLLARACGDADLPPTLDRFLARCAAAGQRRPTPLLLRYAAGGYNCLHQDRYGEVAFPLQATILLSRPGADFSGGEFLLVEQRPRAQSIARVVPLGRGQAVVFPNQHRPVQGTRGTYRVSVRHGVGEVRSGVRFALGVIFHDAA
ncbi:MAG: 2OG-Fe(II) oxygenase [bacterium]|nr:2OG-Fe(II) oxygenase [bacterium]